jgi:N-acetyl-gamma-glutamyl-phosphate reductase
VSARVHVLGAAGFAGAQLAALVVAHPALELGMVTARADTGRRLVDVHPQYRVERRLEAYEPEAVEAGDLAAVCYPHAEAAAVVADLVDRGARVVDVSADHRLRDPGAYPEWYGFAHPRPDLLAEAVYGLPERYRERIQQARLVANPGCYPEAALLGLLPLSAEIEDVVIDAKSGVSGAGRTPTEAVHYSSVAQSVVAYKVFAHRHTPEIEQELGALAGSPLRVAFTPHLVPLNRGLFTTASVPLTSAATTARLLDVYREFYAGEPFVRVLDEGERPTTRSVVGSNYCDVTVVADPRTNRAVCVSAIDNLGKGGAANGVQNLNIMFNWPERAGLEAPPVYP